MMGTCSCTLSPRAVREELTMTFVLPQQVCTCFGTLGFLFHFFLFFFFPTHPFKLLFTPKAKVSISCKILLQVAAAWQSFSSGITLRCHSPMGAMTKDSTQVQGFSLCSDNPADL